MKTITFLLAGLLLIACELKKHDIPAEESIIEMYPELSVQPSSYTGVYVNYDSNAVIFAYKIDIDADKHVSEYIEKIVKLGEWEAITQEAKTTHVGWASFRRIDRENKRYKGWHSLEILKIVSCGQYTVFGAIQSDFRDHENLISNNIDGGKWYRSKFWPLFSAHTDKVCART